MNQYSTFIFDSYSFDESAKRIELKYSLDSDVTFTETIQLPADRSLEIQDPDALNRALFMLHLIGGMSYYKTCLPKKIEIRSGGLSEEQAEFWNTVYTQGLGEFFFKNEIDFRGLINFPTTSAELRAASPHSKPEARSSKLLIPVGGGKDSTVTIELLKKSNVPITLFRVGHHPLIDEVAKIAGLPLLTVDRRLDPLLFKLNTEGALNGHVPITAYLSILCVVLSECYGFTDIAFSNERSANEGNTEMHGMMINHQWSKSLSFEESLRSYLQQYVTNSVEYFSVLRPLSELHIVQLFAQYPQYFECFTSCNANWKILKSSELRAPSSERLDSSQPEALHSKLEGRWCSHCPKCAFAFALLAAFLPKEKVTEIFGKNLFEDASLLPLYKELLGIEGIKPFECVGTPEETYAAMMLASEQDRYEDTPVMKMFEEEASDLFPKADSIVEQLLKPSLDHCIPETFQSLLPR